MDGIIPHTKQLLDEIQNNLFERAKKYRQDHYSTADTFEEFKEILNTKGGFIEAHWDGTVETELKIKEQTKATIRCIPLDAKQESGKCIFSGQPSERRVIFAKSY